MKPYARDRKLEAEEHAEILNDEIDHMHDVEESNEDMVEAAGALLDEIWDEDIRISAANIANKISNAIDRERVPEADRLDELTAAECAMFDDFMTQSEYEEELEEDLGDER